MPTVLFALLVRVLDYVWGAEKKRRQTTAHLVIGSSPEACRLIRRSSGCRRRDSSWKTKFSSSRLGTCQRTPSAATSPARPQSCRRRPRKLWNRCRFFPLEQLAGEPAQPVSFKTADLCRLLVFTYFKGISKGLEDDSANNRKHKLNSKSANNILKFKW